MAEGPHPTSRRGAAPRRESRSTLFPYGTTLFALGCILWLLGIAGLWELPGIARWSVGLLYIVYDTWLIVYVALELRDHRTATSPATVDVAAGGPRVAVLIAARNEALALPATLDALLDSRDPAEEIWLIDDGSSDGTLRMLVDRYGLDAGVLHSAAAGVAVRSASHPSLRVLAKPNSGKADSLNRAIAVMSCDLIITLDADTVLRADAIGAMRRAFEHDPRWVAAGGVLRPRCGPGSAGPVFEWFQTFEYLRSFIARVAWMRANALLLVSGAFACYRRDALQAVGGFDPKSWVEDYKLNHRLHRHAAKHGLPWRVGVLPGAVATTDVPGSLGAFLRQRRRWFAGFLQTLYRYRAMVGNPAYGRVGTLMLPLKVLDTLQPLFGITAFVLLADFALRRQAVLAPVLLVIGAKLVVDFIFLMWGVRFYTRWTQISATPRVWISAGFAALTEPFFFQLLRHTGALFGWFAVLTRRVDWLPERSAAPRTGDGHERYTRTAMALHWAIAVLLAGNIGLALAVDYLPDEAVRPVIDTHKSIGITVLGLVLLRVLWRLTHAPPPLAAGLAAWERRIAHLVHGALYVSMLALPLSGWLHDSAWKDAATHPMRLFGVVEWPRIGAIMTLAPAQKETLHGVFGQIHSWLADLLYGLFAAHLLGVLKHQWFDRQPQLQRMLPNFKTDRGD